MTAALRLACLLCVLLPAVTAHGTDLPPGILHVDGVPAPALALADLDGTPYDLAQTQGHWRFVHFWASWCGPCRREMPSIQQLLPLLGDTDLEIVLVNTAETEDEVFAFLAAVAPDLVPLLDSDGLVTEAWQPRGLPATFLVDPAGRIRYQALGGRPWTEPAYVGFLHRLAPAQSAR
ncbi:MAG: TlpA disulfide reductase family protein [Pseudomonadota bacterium]